MSAAEVLEYQSDFTTTQKLRGFSRGRSSHYDPEVGRWASKDPLGFAGSDTNLYGYVANDPINFVDPTGKFLWNAAGATVGFISGGLGGYATGGWTGAVAGSVVGAAVGAFNPWASSAVGAAAGGVASSLLGQVLGNLLNDRPLATIDPTLAVASGFAGATSAMAVTGFGISNMALEGAIGAASEAGWNIPTQNLSPGPYNFGNLCK